MYVIKRPGDTPTHLIIVQCRLFGNPINIFLDHFLVIFFSSHFNGFFCHNAKKFEKEGGRRNV